MTEPGAADSVQQAAAASSPSWLEDFQPRRYLSNGHLQTIAGNFLPRKWRLPEPESRLVEVEAATRSRVLCHCHWQPEEVRAGRPTVVLVHGLEGSSSSQYVLGNAARAWAAGWNVVRMNMRNCGGTDHLSPGFYNSALSGDVGAVVKDAVAAHGLRRIALVGYSMGGNLVLKLAGEWRDGMPELRAVATVSPAMDLAVSSDALHLPSNRVYEWKFLRDMLRRIHRKAALFPDIYSGIRLNDIRSLRQFDDRIIAPFCGYAGADDYYYQAASTRVADRIAVPTLILHALDDPFIRMLPSTRELLLANPSVALVETAHGGHCAFLATPNGYDGYWAEKTLFGFLREAMGE